MKSEVNLHDGQRKRSLTNAKVAVLQDQAKINQSPDFGEGFRKNWLKHSFDSITNSAGAKLPCRRLPANTIGKTIKVCG